MFLEPPIRKAVGGPTKVEFSPCNLKTEEGGPLDCNYLTNSKANRAIICLHMLGGNKDMWRHFQQKMLKKGFASISFNWRGNRKSGTPEDKQQYYEKSHAHYQKFYKDAIAARDFLISQGFKDECIGVAGGSVGSSTALRYASLINKKIPAIALLSPGKKYVGIDSVAEAKHYGRRPIFITYAAQAYGEPEAAQAIAAQMPDRSLVTLEGFDGNFTAAHAELQFIFDPTIVDRLVAFFDKNVPRCS